MKTPTLDGALMGCKNAEWETRHMNKNQAERRRIKRRRREKEEMDGYKQSSRSRSRSVADVADMFIHQRRWRHYFIHYISFNSFRMEVDGIELILSR